MKDVLIVYELRNRELENAALLAAELEFRGLSVSFANVTSLKRYFTKAKLVVAPHLYNDFHVIAIAKNFWLSQKRIIDLQYEQVLCENDHEGIHNPTGEAKEAQHIAWGEAQYRSYIEHGIKEENIHVTGHMAMDFVRNEFESYFLNREEIASKFCLDKSKEWVLFISSFSYCNRTEKELDALEKMFAGTRVFAEFSNSSQRVILDWLKQIAIKYPDKTFIYRPHPAEKSSKVLKQIEVEIPNFRCIPDLSVRQWVKVCNKLYTWYSTSIADAYYSGRNCQIIRPIEIPKGYEVDIMVGASFITNIDEFETSLTTNVELFPISDKQMEYYYGEKDVKPAFIKVADLCETMRGSDVFDYSYHYGSRFNILNSKSIKNVINIWIERALVDLSTHFRLSKLLFLWGGKGEYLKNLEKLHYGANKEFTEQKKKLSLIVPLFHI